MTIFPCFSMDPCCCRTFPLKMKEPMSAQPPMLLERQWQHPSSTCWVSTKSLLYAVVQPFLRILTEPPGLGILVVLPLTDVFTVVILLWDCHHSQLPGWQWRDFPQHTLQSLTSPPLCPLPVGTRLHEVERRPSSIKEDSVKKSKDFALKENVLCRFLV